MKDKYISFWVTAEFLQKIDDEAAKRMASRSQVLREALIRGLSSEANS